MAYLLSELHRCSYSPDVAIDDVLLFPLVVEGCDVLCQELLEGLPEKIMFRFEQGTFHANSYYVDVLWEN
ncbi:hypothetical protein AS032_34975 [Rhodococcus qingshengii]|nr:hypothetical protein AOT96_32285 [Rhodococcus sp. 008]KSU57388.1 hypothetical protein AS032_34975 [Rhodococcus qingshengii]